MKLFAFSTLATKAAFSQNVMKSGKSFIFTYEAKGMYSHNFCFKMFFWRYVLTLFVYALYNWRDVRENNLHWYRERLVCTGDWFCFWEGILNFFIGGVVGFHILLADIGMSYISFESRWQAGLIFQVLKVSKNRFFRIFWKWSSFLSELVRWTQIANFFV